MFDYAYDAIGNRRESAEWGRDGRRRVTNYTSNELNQYVSRTVPGYVAVRGEADEPATVTINEQPVFRHGRYFYGGDVADNRASSVRKDVEVYAAVNPPGTNVPDTVYAVTTSVFVAKSPELFTYDADGNMTSDGRFRYYWNGENRMICASNDEVCVTFVYDHRGRMIRKDISRVGAEAQSVSYIWDNWNIVSETLTTLKVG